MPPGLLKCGRGHSATSPEARTPVPTLPRPLCQNPWVTRPSDSSCHMKVKPHSTESAVCGTKDAWLQRPNHRCLGARVHVHMGK